MHAEVSQSVTTAVPGQPVVLTIDVINTETIISKHNVHVLGVDENWVTVDDTALSLFPEASGTAIVTITLPEGIPSGSRHIAIEVREVTAPMATAVLEVELVVPAERDLRMSLEQVMVTGGSSAHVGIRLENGGNETIAVSLLSSEVKKKAKSAPPIIVTRETIDLLDAEAVDEPDESVVVTGRDDEEQISFAFDRDQGVIEPGEQMTLTTSLKARRRFAGSPKVRPYILRAQRADTDEPPVEAYGTFVQRPLISRGLLSLMGLLLAASVFAAIITIALSSIAGKSASDRQLLLQVLRANEQNGAAAGQVGTVSGTVRAVTGTASVTVFSVAAFNVQDTSNPAATTVSDDTGHYKLTGLAPGNYKFRFSGVGFAPMWYAQSVTVDNATAVKVGQEPVTLPPVLVAGLPASIKGTVLGENVGGATVTLQIPPAPGKRAVAAALTSDTLGAFQNSSGQVVPLGKVVATTTVDSTGAFVIESVPAPVTYEVLVTKPGFAAAAQKVNLAGGEERKDVLLRLQVGDGLIEGTVTSAAGPVANATVSATDGTNTLTTVTQTGGQFDLRNLATPATYTVTVTKESFADQTATLSLTQGQQLRGVSVAMEAATGSITGTVSLLQNRLPTAKAGGVSVAVTDGAVVLKTVTLTSGNPGSYSVEGIPVPGTYTVVFSRSDLATEARTLALDTASGSSRANFDVTMRTAQAAIAGLVSDKKGFPVDNVTVRLTNGKTAFEVRTATAGGATGPVFPDQANYEIDNIPPGTYTLSFNRQGARPTSSIVTLSAGQVLDDLGNEQTSPTLEDGTGISGVVTIFGNPGAPLAGAEVRLYLATGYPNDVIKSVITGADGKYKFDNLDAPVTYIVEFSFPPGTGQQTRLVKLKQSDPIDDLNVALKTG